MADVKWIKIATNMFDNRKIKLIDSMPDRDAIIVIWYKLLCLAGNCNDGGIVYFDKSIPFTDEMLSTIFNRPLNTIRLALETFKKFKMIDIVDDFIQISNWEKYQNTDKLETLKEANRERQKRFYEKKKAQKQLENSKPNVRLTLELTQPNALDIDKDIDSSINTTTTAAKPADVKSSSSSKPSLEEVISYAKENNFVVDPVNFYNHCESINWQIDGNPIRSWKYGLKVWNDNYLKAKSTKTDIELEDWQIDGMADIMKDFK